MRLPDTRRGFPYLLQDRRWRRQVFCLYPVLWEEAAAWHPIRTTVPPQPAAIPPAGPSVGNHGHFHRYSANHGRLHTEEGSDGSGHSTNVYSDLTPHRGITVNFNADWFIVEISAKKINSKIDWVLLLEKGVALGGQCHHTRKDALDIFKKDLGTFSRFYEFISQIVAFDDKELEKLNLFARHLAPLLREDEEEPDHIDLSGVELTHYRLQKQREQDLKLREEEGKKLKPGTEFGSGSSRNKDTELLSRIIERMNNLFAAENLSEADLVSYARTIADKIQENEAVMSQVANNTPEQTMLGDFPAAVQEAVLASGDAHQELMTQFLCNKAIQLGFGKLILEMLTKSA